MHITEDYTLYNEQLLGTVLIRIFFPKKLRKYALQGLESNRKVEILKFLMFAPETSITYV